MFSENVPEFTIDLARDEYRRWDEVIAADIDLIKELTDDAEEDLVGYVPRFVTGFLGRRLASSYLRSGGRYWGEMEAWANALGRPVSDLILVNCSYELSHLAPSIGIFGCTAGVVQTKSGLVHVRSMDWALKHIGEATRIFRYKRGPRSFVAVGVSGYMGVLSGMLPGAYSVTINWAPPVGVPTFDFGPSFLLREVLETCDTYIEALCTLMCTPLSTSVFYTLCGTEPGQACVIERTQNGSSIRKMKGRVLTQANHFVTDKFFENNSDQEVVDYSIERMDLLQEGLEDHVQSMKAASDCLDIEEVFNTDTEQQMAFCPKTGKMKAWRWLDT